MLARVISTSILLIIILIIIIIIIIIINSEKITVNEYKKTLEKCDIKVY